MTPNARYAAAIDILEDVFAGAPAEKTLTNWARSNRYAGSKDRAAVRDIVFDCLRCKRSFIFAAGFEGARGCVAGRVLAEGVCVNDVFTGEKFAPAVLSAEEDNALNAERGAQDLSVRLDIPDWVAPYMKASLGDEMEPCLTALQKRGTLDLRVNLGKATLKGAIAALAKEEIEAEPVALSPTALRVLTNPRRVALSDAYQSGVVEIQDAGSQAVVDALPLDGVQTVLDYCAGGGGKTLALAGRSERNVQFAAYDQSQVRMKDIPVRAKRAGHKVRVFQEDPVGQAATYDLVLLDVPCSGTGAWRRNPDGKWRFTQDELDALCVTQRDILSKTQALVAENGVLAYVTCSVLLEENENQILTFLNEHSDWCSVMRKRFLPSGGTDGFYLEVLRRK